MKTTMSIILVLFISLSSMGSNYKPAPAKETLTATYKGLTEEGKFKFTDAKGAVVLFDAVDDNVTIDLYEEEFIGAKFTVTFENKSEDAYDDEGEPTGEKVIVKTISALKKL